ncbi:unnamed protein product [Vicia faba]|uniref:Uncharacterized protein n=1 Tax=Vicia faba TaxID=3906 RepID=A0AAV0ZCE9_VICFA|nr:unnamed protein product [Vicia faba]
MEPTLKGGPQARGSTKHKISALRNFLGYGKGFLPKWNRWNSLLSAKYTELGLPFVQPLPLFYSDLYFLLCFLVSSILLCLQPVLELYPVLPLACPEDGFTLQSRFDHCEFGSSLHRSGGSLRGDGKVGHVIQSHGTKLLDAACNRLHPSAHPPRLGTLFILKGSREVLSCQAQAGKPLLYEAENDRSKTEKIE